MQTRFSGQILWNDAGFLLILCEIIITKLHETNI